MNQIEDMILEFFDNYLEARTSELVEHTGIARRTVQKYLKILVEKASRFRCNK